MLAAMKWQDWANVALGVWLAASPWASAARKLFKEAVQVPEPAVHRRPARPEDAKPVQARKGAPMRISEHDPFWQEAVIQVQDVHKGDPKLKQVVVRFSGSTDVHWHKSPKFQKGHKGTWMLHAEEAAPARAARKAVAAPAARRAAAAQPSFTCVDPIDFQPEDQSETTRAMHSLLRTMAPAASKKAATTPRAHARRAVAQRKSGGHR